MSGDDPAAQQPGDGPESGAQEEPSFLSHLVELRQRLVRAILCIGVVFIPLYAFANDLYTYVAGPLLAQLPPDTSMIAIEVASPFLIPFKLTLMAAIFLSIPYILYQVWAFVAPGLYLHERRLVRPLVVSSTLLFYAGVAFAYFVVFPIAFAFFTHSGPEQMRVMTDISRYLDFVITMFFAFGIAFEVPIAVILLVMAGVITPEDLARKRPYFIVAAFVVGMLLTPPDVLSQTLLALPMWVLFEVGIVMSKVMRRRQRNESADAGPGPPS